jgi:hypothetical protein
VKIDHSKINEEECLVSSTYLTEVSQFLNKTNHVGYAG